MYLVEEVTYGEEKLRSKVTCFKECLLRKIRDGPKEWLVNTRTCRRVDDCKGEVTAQRDEYIGTCHRILWVYRDVTIQDRFYRDQSDKNSENSLIYHHVT